MPTARRSSDADSWKWVNRADSYTQDGRNVASTTDRPIRYSEVARSDSIMYEFDHRSESSEFS